jgi:hypothetical protein
LAALKLQEEGKLKLSDTLKQWLPEVAFENPWESTDPVRLVHLMEHTTGFDDCHLREYAFASPIPARLLDGLAYGARSRVCRWRPGTRMAGVRTFALIGLLVQVLLFAGPFASSAGDAAPALDGLRADLDLCASVTRVLDETGEATLFAPLHREATDWTLARAFATGRARSGRLTAVGVDSSFASLVDRHAERLPGVGVEHVTLAEALQRLASGSAGVLVAEDVLGEALSSAPRLNGKRRLVATGQLSPTGPGLFAPAEGTSSDLAGQGVADPSAMLLATALLLSEGLGRVAAGEALEDSLTLALRAQRRPSEASGPRVAATTREFVDAVLGLLPSARRDTEFALGAAR